MPDENTMNAMAGSGVRHVGSYGLGTAVVAALTTYLHVPIEIAMPLGGAIAFGLGAAFRRYLNRSAPHRTA